MPPASAALAKGFHDSRGANPLDWGKFVGDVFGGIAFGVGGAMAERHLIPALLEKRRKGNPLSEKEAGETLDGGYQLLGQATREVNVESRHRLYGMAYQAALMVYAYAPKKNKSKWMKRSTKLAAEIRKSLGGLGLPMGAPMPPFPTDGKNPMTSTGLWYPKKGTKEAKRHMKRLRKMKNPALLEAVDNPRRKSARRMTKAGTAFVSKKVGKLMREGYPQPQAVAIAFNMARKKGFKVPPAPNPVGLPPVPPHIMSDPDFKRELAVFRKRHGSGPIEIFKVKVPKGFPKFMTAYGHAPAVLYDAHKRSSKGKRIHKFGEAGKQRPFLVSSQKKGRKFLAYVGGDFRAEPDWLYD